MQLSTCWCRRITRPHSTTTCGVCVQLITTCALHLRTHCIYLSPIYIWPSSNWLPAQALKLLCHMLQDGKKVQVEAQARSFGSSSQLRGRLQRFQPCCLPKTGLIYLIDHYSLSGIDQYSLSVLSILIILNFLCRMYISYSLLDPRTCYCQLIALGVPRCFCQLFLKQ